MTSEYPLFKLGDAVAEYLKAHEMTASEFGRQVGSSPSMVRDMIEERLPIQSRRIYVILRFLKMLDRPVEDFDPRITRLPEIRDIIKREMSEGASKTGICQYLDICNKDTLSSMLATLCQGLDTCGMTYGAASKLFKVLDDGFHTWCITEGRSKRSAHIDKQDKTDKPKPKRKWDSTRSKENGLIRSGRRARGLHDHEATEVPPPEQCEKLLRQWLRSTGHTDGVEVGVYDSDKNAIEWDTDTGLYHITMAWQPYGADFTAVWNNTGAVSVSAQYNAYWGKWFRNGIETSEACSHAKPQRPYSRQLGMPHRHGDEPSIAAWHSWKEDIDAIRRTLREDT